MKTLHTIIFIVLALGFAVILLALASLQLAILQVLTLVYMGFIISYALYLNNYINNLKN